MTKLPSRILATVLAVGATFFLSSEGSLSEISETCSLAQQESTLKNSIGVVTLNKKSFNVDIKSKIHFYNKDDSLWLAFSFSENARKETQAEIEKVNFDPFAFHLDYLLLALKCVNANSQYFEVVVNDEIGLTKYIRKDDLIFKFETWATHIIQRFGIDFNKSSNPLRTGPTQNARLAQMPKDVIFRPIQIKGDWVKVRWEVPSTVKEARYGWVKWREGTSLLVYLLYFA